VPKKGALWDPRGGKSEAFETQFKRGFFSPYNFVKPGDIRKTSQLKPFATLDLLSKGIDQEPRSKLVGKTLIGL